MNKDPGRWTIEDTMAAVTALAVCGAVLLFLFWSNGCAGWMKR